MSIADRIAVLNLGQVGKNPTSAPQRSPRPKLPPRTQSADTQISQLTSITASPHDGQPVGNLPDRQPPTLVAKVPAQTQLTRAPPTLPPRKHSDVTLARQTSADSTISNRSSICGVSNLPTSCRTSISALSQTSTVEGQNDAKCTLQGFGFVASTPGKKNPPLLERKIDQNRPSPPPRPSYHDSLANSVTPARLSNPQLPTNGSTLQNGQNTAKWQVVGLKDTPKALVAGATRPRRSPLEWGLNTDKKADAVPVTPSLPARAKPQSQPTPPPSAATLPVVADEAPPIPLNSRPRISDLARQTSQPPPISSIHPSPITSSLTTTHQPLDNSPTICLPCHDFTAADTHASRFPLASLPNHNIHWLASALTSPFPSPTEKARALFTWLHHNITYDCASFFGPPENRKPSTPARTLATGLAVCEGYAALFAAMAISIGMECVVVVGHGKGVGYTAPPPGSQLSPYEGNHAWNAVRLESGWKLLDSCWGAGHLSPSNKYEKHFNPQHFSMTNEEFGLRHFPQDQGMWFRADGGVVGWEEYLLGGDLRGGEDVTVYKMAGLEGIGSASFMPGRRDVSLSQLKGAGVECVRFEFARVCRHWDPVVNGLGKSYVYALAQGEGMEMVKGMRVFRQVEGEEWRYRVVVQVKGLKLGNLSVFAVTTVGGKDARGMKVDVVERAFGRLGVGFGGIAQWMVVP